MRIAGLHIKGFRNFVDEDITLDDKTLIVGGNDTGKTNMLYALRILFDPKLSARDFELTSSDFNIYSNPNAIEITAKLEDIHEDCVISALQGAIKDGVSYIQYTLRKGKDYEFATGYSEDALETCNGRPYIKNLALEYVGSNRDLASFLKRQQNKLLDISRNQRDDNQESEDTASINTIQKNLLNLNEQISGLHYVSESLSKVNEEMGALSFSNERYSAKFVAGNTDANKLLDNLRLAYLHDDSPLVFGGEGRSNQLYFATWLSEQRLVKRPERAVIYAIEEPEAHLHPHQQRALAEHLSLGVDGQVLITTHSPQIVERFNGGRILRLASAGLKGLGHVCGCSTEVDDALDKMGYRLNAISSEVFFSSGVLLVEGPSERILYKALSRELGMDIDRLNISILSVDGVGFEPYLRACVNLGIPFAIRTDNDVISIKDHHRLAGVKRLVDLAEKYTSDEELARLIEKKEGLLSWTGDADEPEPAKQSAREIVPALGRYGLYLSTQPDLEHDLAASPLLPQLEKHFNADTPEGVVKVMQHRKAESMHSFISSDPDLSCLKDDPISSPLNHVVHLVKSATN